MIYLQGQREIIEEEKIQIPEVEEGISYEPLKFGVELVPAKGIEKLVDYGVYLEQGGLKNIWITDHYTNMDPYILLTLMANATNSVKLGLGVTNPFTRHVAATACAISALDYVSKQRVILGLGAGDTPTLASLNMEAKKIVNTISETVQAIRLLWNEKIVNFNGEFVTLKNARLNFKPAGKVPLYIGAQGPKMLELAGEIGDGILINASDELDFKIARKLITQGANKANRKVKDLDIVAYTCFSVSDDKDSALQSAFQVIAFIAAATPDNVLERHDLDIAKARKMKACIEKGNIPKAFELVDSSFIEAFSITGTPEQCIDKIETLKKVGVTQFVFGSPLGPKKQKAVELIREKILSCYT